MTDRIDIHTEPAQESSPAFPSVPLTAPTGAGTEIVTLGCRLNASESETMRGLARQASLTDTVIVNSCAVTGEAVRQTRQAIRRARRAQPGARIVVAGCAAQIDPDSFASMPEVDAVIGSAEKLRADTFGSLAVEPPARRGAARIMVGDIMAEADLTAHRAAGAPLGAGAAPVRAFLEIQQGCDHRCTFCIIPFGRGNNRSAPAGDIVREARALVAAGAKEIVLTGVDITGWGTDLPGHPTLGQLARRLLKLVPELLRLRLSSVDVAEIDRDLLALIESEPRLMPHLHLSLQSGADMILKRMKRRHSRAQAMAFCETARRLRPDIAFGADLIAGFPTETDSMHRDSVALIRDCDIAFAHVFPYSARHGTPAARMPQLPMAVRKERAAALRAESASVRRAHLDRRMGREIGLLVEDLHDGTARGHSDCFARVAVRGAEAASLAPGMIVRRRAARHDGERLIVL